MAQIQDVMTTQVHSVPRDATLVEVARVMRDEDIGDVLVVDLDGALQGIVTDRDIVVRAIAEGRSLDRTQVHEICTGTVINLAPDASIDEAVRLMRERAIRRVPVVSQGKPIGIVSIGDLAQHQDPRSALAAISSAAPNN